MTTTAKKKLPRIIIVGGGFGGLEAAKALAGVEAELTIVDRRNYHVFQPLLYQVATAALSPAQICSPIRKILRGQANCEVVLAEVTGVDIEKRHVNVSTGYMPYDYLILAAGATHSYFGHDDWATIAPGLKGIEDATELRKRLLLAYESAELEGNAEARQARLTFGIVGGGPTGVELAGAIKEIAGKTLPGDYKHIDPQTTRVIIFDSGKRLLAQFPPESSERAMRDLERMGVEVHLNSIVTKLTREGVYVGEKFFPVGNTFWAAGVKASALGKTLGVALDKSGRVIVGPDLTIPGHPEVFIVGDLAAAKSAKTQQPVPGVAPAAQQMGRYAARIIAAGISGTSDNQPRPPFNYHDKGSIAVIGKARAVVAIGKLKFGGFFAWLFWGGVHIAFLVGFRNRAQVLASWFWSWLLNSRDARLITGDSHVTVESPRSPEFARSVADQSASSTKQGAL